MIDAKEKSVVRKPVRVRRERLDVGIAVRLLLCHNLPRCTRYSMSVPIRKDWTRFFSPHEEEGVYVFWANDKATEYFFGRQLVMLALEDLYL